MNLERQIKQFLKGILFLLLAFLPQLTHAQTGRQITLKRILDGAKGQLSTDSATTVSDTAYFSSALAGKLDTPYQVRNIIAFTINEYAKVVLPDSFRATVNLRIYYTLSDRSVDSVDQSLSINYDTASTYRMRSSFVFNGAHQVNVKVLGLIMMGATNNTAFTRTVNTESADIVSALMIINEMEVYPVYKLSCTADAVKSVNHDITSVDKQGELAVGWPVMTGADVYDLEWAYIDQSALADGRYGNSSNPSPALIFENNTTRVTISDNNYSIPLLYDAPGTLYYRVRGVQERIGYQRIETAWSSNTASGLGAYQYGGHEPTLNWESSIDFAEDGKRNITIKYFDGSLRRRQFVTKDNTTNTVVAAETLYDYQGRPAIQVLPSPTLSKLLSYAHNLNSALNGVEYDKDQYDALASPETYLTASAAQMSNQSGANQYYSPNNPEKTIGHNQYIPDGEGYAFSETEYTTDNTDRILRQGGVGKTFKLGSGHETKYTYNTPTKNELYALFGTEVGDETHYFKNTVTDGNGRTSVNYLDMHDRIIATAVAGTSASNNQENLSSMNSIVVTDTLSGADKAIIEGSQITSRKEHFATQGDSVRFVYELTPPVLQNQECKDTIRCYTGMYDLEIRITDDVFNQRLPGGKPVDKVLRAKLDTISVDCNKPSQPIRLEFSLWLDKGSYTFTKTLTISQAAMDYYRDSVFLKNNICTSYEQILEGQKAIQRTIPCEPDCASCLAGIGLWEDYRLRYMTDNGYAADSVEYRAAAWAAYNEALASCNELCGKGTETDAMRQAMLLDMSAPGGQYALPRDTANKYSIFFLDMKDTTYTYADPSIRYLNEIGELDMVYDVAGGEYVLPQKLSPSEFAAAFKSSWAEALLPLHPEYCKLVTKSRYRSTEEWNIAFEGVETYAEARNAGYLNPLGMGNVPFTIKNTDPLNDTLKNKLIPQLNLFNNSGYSMWSVAVASVKCDESGSGCISNYKTPAEAFNNSDLCEGDLNMAWRSFRSMYLGAKRTVIDEYLKSLNCGASAKELLDSGKVLRFTSTNDQLASTGLDGKSYLKDEQTARAASDKLADSAYTANCNVYVSYWVQQLSGCYDTTSIKEDIIPKLLEVCKQGSDADHPRGSSSVRPGSTYRYRSFEEVIDDYNRQRGRSKDMVCNADVITMPKPYDRQVSYGDQPTFAPPSDCQCEKITELKREYNSMKVSSETFSAYIYRKRGVSISQDDLNALESACTNRNSSCNWLPKALVLPSIFQCNVAPACATCEDVNRLYTSFKSTYGITPLLTEEDSVQDKKNDFFAAYMNNRLGFAKQAWEYLAFINDSCKQASGNGVEVCKPGSLKGNPQVSTYSNGSVDEINDIVRSRDGGYLLAGWTRGCSNGQEDAYLIKTDSTGALLWSKTYGAENHEEIKRIRQTRDGGYIGIGSTNSYCYDNGAILLVKFDSAGVVEWNKALDLGSTGYTGRGTDVIETLDSNYAFAGQGLPSKWIMGVVTGGGELKWSKVLSSGDRKEQMSLVENGDTLVAGTAIAIGIGNYDAAILKFSKADGSLLEQSGYSADNSDHIPGSILKTVNGYKLVGLNSATLVDINSAGTIVSARKAGAPGSIISGSVTATGTADGSLLLSQSASGTTGGAYWQKVGSNNGVLWSSHVGVSGQEYLRHIVSNVDGTMAGGGVMDGKAMLMLANASGKTGCKDSSELINSVDIMTSTLRKVLPTQTITDVAPNLLSAVALNEQRCTAVRSMTSCPGMDSCYRVYDLPLMCGNMGVFPTVPLDESTACSDSTFFAESAATIIYKAYTDSVKNNFNETYLQTALKATSLEKFAVTYSTSEYHYTLYYYDQAGNLVKTVPPAGVAKNLRQSWVDSVDAAKAANRTLVPSHTMPTTYRYNSLGEMVAQKTPDAGTSQFWYDRLGRLVTSQNYKQKNHFQYGYIVYDELGRINELGELSSGTQMTDVVSRNPVTLAGWMNNVASSRHEITRTTYDVAYPFFESENFIGRNLRNRVSWRALYNIADSLATGGHSTATFYSYDIHGNVDTLLQDYKAGVFADGGHRFKKIAYNYDLIAGKVNEVAYQAGEADAFYHRYQYDGENRLTNVETSRDKVYWENDAYYNYYKHGSLARVVIGQQQVQGIDYVYTLQGWLKGVNSTSLTTANDPGEDGKEGSTIPKDAFGYTLHYFGNEDYKSINIGKQPFAAAAGDFKPLYNGNISSIGQHIEGIGNPLLYTYTYDVLNRLKGMQAYQGLDLSINAWNATPIEDFKESISYDGNGNILTYDRNGNHIFAGQPLDMDKLAYKYRPGTNKLDWIDDAVASDNYSTDIDKQEPVNYAYDSIGNLVKDISAGIKQTGWTIYNKIAYIVKADNDTIHYTYDVAGNRISKRYQDIVTWYVRDAEGNLLSTYTRKGDDPVLQSQVAIYGVARLGMVDFMEQPESAEGEILLLPKLGTAQIIDFVRGEKNFELSNHLGNVLATVTDRKEVRSQDKNVSYHYKLSSATEYYPFGMQMPGRTNNSAGYRYGFNGKENDNEVKGEGNQQDYGMRIYDPRVARFLSVDPLTKTYPELTPYQFGSNRPIDGIDLDGKEWTKTETYDPKTGITNVHFHVKLKVFNDSKIFNDVEALKQEVIAQFTAAFKGVGDGKTQYSGDLEIVSGPRNGKGLSAVLWDNPYEPAGGTTMRTDTKNNVSVMNVYDKTEGAKANKARAAKYVAQDIVHELIHTGGVQHPDDAGEAEDIQILRKDRRGPDGKLISTYYLGPKAKMEYVIYNIMLYSATNIGGKTVKELVPDKLKRNKVSPGQAKRVAKQIKTDETLQKR